MNAKEFVKSWKREKDYLLELYTKRTNESGISKDYNELNLSNEQKLNFNKIVNTILTDAFYTLLLGLDGEANIGGIQHSYKIFDENDVLISAVGEIEAEACNEFHESIEE